MKSSSVRILFYCMAVLAIGCSKKENPTFSIDGEYAGKVEITTKATQALWDDSITLVIVLDDYEYQGNKNLNEGSGYLKLNADSVRFFDYRTTILPGWDWILLETYKYALNDTMLTLFKESDLKTFYYELKVVQ